ncbi:hypothetical protein [Flavobacterium lipolyticum]|uniref:DUF4476 domain-containing protein n=1 Tax=Flavobacterium lipolyticum TaxID=2893754 RepID=A0ABS8M741_9FLAO|nr:hypothetical protein [Flavobacterium sp. F-126]MCC9020620.1 hypothetical protein [Flavobacterium sp. F-126]
MGTKIILSFLLIGSIAYTQSKDEVHLLKQYSLQKCLKINYHSVDSTFISHDYSASYMLQVKNADYNMLNKLDDFTAKNTSQFYEMGVSENLEDSKANYIFCHCMDFYESKELDKFIKKVLKK